MKTARKNIKLKRSNTGYLMYALVLASQVIKSQNNGNCPAVVLDAIAKAQSDLQKEAR